MSIHPKIAGIPTKATRKFPQMKGLQLYSNATLVNTCAHKTTYIGGSNVHMAALSINAN